MSERLPLHMLDPTGGTPGQLPAINAAGDAFELADPPTGVGGGGGGAIHYADDLGGTNFTTTATGYVTIPGFGLTITPAVAGVLTLTFDVVFYSTLTSALNAKLTCSPAPTVGPTSARIRNDSGTANKAMSYSMTRHYKLAAGVTYTFATLVYQASAGTLTVFGDQEQTELSGMFVPL